MVSVFNTEQLQKLLIDFYRIANIRITVFDSHFSELVSYPENRSSFCSLIRSTEEGRQACAVCDRAACSVASRQNSAYVYRCHAGLTEAVMPLWVGNALVGYLLFGHVFAYKSWDEGWETIQKCCEGYPVDKEKLRAVLPDCPQASDEYILSAAHILHATASFLVMQRMAALKEDSLAAQIDTYINEHFCEDLTAATICRAFEIGRSRVYKLSNQLYGCGISEHIRTLRIQKAKKLLTDHPHMRIAEVALECGFADYNYFITVFSALAGTSPGAYRKQAIASVQDGILPENT